MKFSANPLEKLKVPLRGVALRELIHSKTLLK